MPLDQVAPCPGSGRPSARRDRADVPGSRPLTPLFPRAMCLDHVRRAPGGTAPMSLDHVAPCPWITSPDAGDSGPRCLWVAAQTPPGAPSHRSLAWGHEHRPGALHPSMSRAEARFQTRRCRAGRIDRHDGRRRETARAQGAAGFSTCPSLIRASARSWWSASLPRYSSSAGVV